MSKETAIRRIVPSAAIPGGEMACEFDLERDAAAPRVLIDGIQAHVVAASKHRILALVPHIEGGQAQVTLSFGYDASEVTAPSRLEVGTKLAGDVHPVTNPAFDPSDGTLYVTRSGSRGEHVPVSIYRINS